MAPTDEHARLWYLRWDARFNTEKPYQVVSENMPALAGLPKENLLMEQGPEELIADVRGREAQFNVDDHGFAVRSWHFSPDIDYFNVRDVEGRYLDEVTRMLQASVEGCDEMVLFNWKVGFFSFLAVSPERLLFVR